ncbi:MAG: 50S ribosomal protein L29 [Gammaproteobacteria bacterium]|jgi:large subunit ribosomal protein L29|nr:50S ribosomal protein L29 [Gammaproteobacteria bacterium]
MSTAQKYREMSVEDLSKELINLRREQFNLRMQMGSGNTPKTHLFSVARHNIARVKTVLNEKQAGNN